MPIASSQMFCISQPELLFSVSGMLCAPSSKLDPSVSYPSQSLVVILYKKESCKMDGNDGYLYDLLASKNLMLSSQTQQAISRRV